MRKMGNTFYVKNYTCFEEASLNLAPLTGIIGKGGSGCTSLTRAIRFLARIELGDSPREACKKVFDTKLIALKKDKSKVMELRLGKTKVIVEDEPKVETSEKHWKRIFVFPSERVVMIKALIYIYEKGGEEIVRKMILNSPLPFSDFLDQFKTILGVETIIDVIKELKERIRDPYNPELPIHLVPNMYVENLLSDIVLKNVREGDLVVIDDVDIYRGYDTAMEFGKSIYKIVNEKKVNIMATMRRSETLLGMVQAVREGGDTDVLSIYHALREGDKCEVKKLMIAEDGSIVDAAGMRIVAELAP